MNISLKIIMASVVLSGIGIISAGSLVGWKASSIASEALEKRAFEQLVAIREIQKTQIENYFLSIKNEIVTLSNNRMIINLMTELKEPFFEFENQSTMQNNDQLESYYQDQFDQEYKNRNPASTTSSIEKYRQLNQNSKSIQHAYISGNINSLGNKDKLTSADDGSKYSEIHKLYHPSLSQYLNAFGFYDIFLVEPESGFIIYSVFKELDYATSLLHGPYKNTGLSQAFNSANKSSQRDTSFLIDFKPYFPSYDAAAAFISSPIFSDAGEKLGVLIFQMPIDKINDLMTYEQQWKKVGLGSSGETYLIGDDLLLRSQSRFLIEDKKSYAQALKGAGVERNLIDKITAGGSAIGLQKVDSEGAIAAISGQTAIKKILDYRNIEVLSAFSPLKIPGVNWAILSEVDVAEAMQDKENMLNSIWLFMSLTILILLPLAIVSGYFVGKGISNPIKGFIEQVNKITGDRDLTARVAYSGNDELRFLANSFNHLIDEVQEILQCVENLSATLLSSTEKMLVNMDDTTEQTSRQSENADSVAVATNELLATIQEVARNASDAALTVTKTKDKCLDSNHSAESLSQGMDGLNQQMSSASHSIENLAAESHSIASVLDVIQSIAEQTNLLALNAAIEAARAGEQGRGFAVVADEVRTLASRTQNSTEDIRVKINSLQNETAETVKLVSSSSKMSNTSILSCEENRKLLTEVIELVELLSDMNIQIATAAEQQSSVVDEINRNINEIASTSHNITEKADLSKGDVKGLVVLVKNLKVKMNEFKV